MDSYLSLDEDVKKANHYEDDEDEEDEEDDEDDEDDRSEIIKKRDEEFYNRRHLGEDDLL